MPGGIALVGLLSAALFTAFTGASGVTIVALGGLLYPMLLAQRYSKNFALGLVTCTGSLGLLFPPSLPIILYGLVAKVSIDQLFRAGLIPGLTLIAVLAAYGIWAERRTGAAPTAFSWRAVAVAARAAAWEIPLPFLIVGGIYGGIFTATDSAAVMAFYVVMVEFVIRRDLAMADLPGVVRRSMQLVGAILLVLGTAVGLTNYLIDAQISDRLFAFLHTWVASKTLFLLALNGILLIVNMIEIFSAIIIVVPIIVPVAMQYGIDPVHLGIIFLLNLEIGYMTPPLGLNLFLANRRFDVPLPRLYRASAVFWLIHVAVLLLVTYWPALSLVLVR
jgi:tripartite ATP-independent transporter DctM subunit